MYCSHNEESCEGNVEGRFHGKRYALAHAWRRSGGEDGCWGSVNDSHVSIRLYEISDDIKYDILRSVLTCIDQLCVRVRRVHVWALGRASRLRVQIF
jgi:hypothetical protein